MTSFIPVMSPFHAQEKMTKKHRHKSKTIKRSNRRLNDDAVLEKALGKPRTIGQIIIFGAANQEEEARLMNYLEKSRAACKAFLPNRSIANPILSAALEMALIDLRVAHSVYHHAIQTQHREGSRVLLKKVYGRVEELLRSDKPLEIQAPRPEAVYTMNKPKGFGGYLANSCQYCGRFLATVCYSKIWNSPRVPRTNKICPQCFESLEKKEQCEYQKYRYSTRWEPWGKNMGKRLAEK